MSVLFAGPRGRTGLFFFLNLPPHSYVTHQLYHNDDNRRRQNPAAVAARERRQQADAASAAEAAAREERERAALLARLEAEGKEALGVGAGGEAAASVARVLAEEAPGHYAAFAEVGG